MGAAEGKMASIPHRGQRAVRPSSVLPVSTCRPSKKWSRNS